MSRRNPAALSCVFSSSAAGSGGATTLKVLSAPQVLPFRNHGDHIRSMSVPSKKKGEGIPGRAGKRAFSGLRGSIPCQTFSGNHRIPEPRPPPVCFSGRPQLSGRYCHTGRYAREHALKIRYCPSSIPGLRRTCGRSGRLYGGFLPNRLFFLPCPGQSPGTDGICRRSYPEKTVSPDFLSVPS